MSYYHDLITEKSWQELQQLQRKFKFVLIGGWAVWLYTKALKSKDIDVLVEYAELGKLRKEYEVVKNERLKKYEARKGEIQIDVYLPHYSNLGVGVEKVMDKIVSKGGFKVLKKEWLVGLKLFSLGQRARTVKGQKDWLDLLCLFRLGVERKEWGAVLKTMGLKQEIKLFKQLMGEATEVKELGINKHEYKRIKVNILRLVR